MFATAARSTRLRLLCVVSCAWIVCAPGEPAAAQTVNVIPALRTGDEFRLEVVHTRENSQRPQQNATVTTPVHVLVVSVTPAETVLDWKPGVAASDSAATLGDPLARAAVEVMGDITLRIALDSDGNVSRLVNEADVIQRLQAAVAVIVKGVSEKLPENERPDFQTAVARLLSPQVLVLSAIRDAQTFFGLSGASLDVGEEVEIDIEQPNPFGAEPLSATLWVRADSATADTFVVLTRTSYDPDAMRALTKAVLAQAGASLPPAELANPPVIDMRDEGRYVFDRTVGIAREIALSRVMSIGPQGRTERWRFRLVETPKR